MNVVAFIIVMLFSPILAADCKNTSQQSPDEALLGHYSQLIENLRKSELKLNSEIDATLGAREDDFIKAYTVLQTKRQNLKPVPPQFNEELDELQRHFSPHEELLAPLREAVLKGLTIGHLKPFDDIISRLESFRLKWEATGGLYKIFRMIISIIQDYQKEWQTFANKCADNIAALPNEDADLTLLYRMISGTFFKWPADLKKAMDENRDKFGHPHPEWYERLLGIQGKLQDFLQAKGKILWDTMLNALARRGAQLSGCPNDYFLLDELFMYGENPIKTLIINIDELPKRTNSTRSGSSDDSWSTTYSPSSSPTTSDTSLIIDKYRETPAHLVPTTPPATPKSRSISHISNSSPHHLPAVSRSLPTTPLQIRQQIPSRTSLSSFSLSSRQGNPQSISQIMSSGFAISRKGSQTRKLIPYEALDIDTLAEELRDNFIPHDFQELIESLDDISAKLLNPSCIISPLKSLVAYYKEAKREYIRSPNVWELLTPKATLQRANQLSLLLTQSSATNVCMRWRHQALCFNCPDSSVLKQLDTEARQEDANRGHGWEKVLGNLVFTPIREGYPFNVGATTALSILEALFGITEFDTLGFLTIDSIAYMAPKKPSSIKISDHMVDREHWEIVETYMGNPEDWHPATAHFHLTARRQTREFPLFSFLEQIYSGNATFDQIDPHSFGMHFIFSLFTGSTRPLEQLSLVDVGTDTYRIKRTGNADLMAPIIRTIDEPAQREISEQLFGSRHSYIGRNCLLLFPQTEDKVIDSVRNVVLKHNILLLLPYWLKELSLLKKYFDPIIRKYQLDKEDETSEDFKIKITQAQRLGLIISQRAGMIKAMIKNYHTLIEALRLNPEITYQELLELVQPQEAECIRQIKQITNRKLTVERPIGVFFSQLAPKLFESSQAIVLSVATNMPPEIDLKNEAEHCFTAFDNCLSSSNVAVTFDDVISKRHESVQAFFKQKYNRATQAWARDRDNVMTFFQKVVPSTIKKLKKVHALSNTPITKPQYTLAELEELSELSNALLLNSQSAYITTFDQLISSIKIPHRQFFSELYRWWLNIIDGPRVEFILKAWQIMTAERAIGLSESVIHQLSRNDDNWFYRYRRLSTNQPSVCQMFECNHSLSQMVQELVECTDLSSMSPSLAIGIIDVLLELQPNFDQVHRSWGPMLQRGLVHMPASMLTVAKRFGWSEQRGHEELRLELIKRLEEYAQYSRRNSRRHVYVPTRPMLVAAAAASSSSLPIIEHQVSIPELTDREAQAFVQLRELLRGTVVLNSDKEGILLDAIVDLLILPQASNQPTLPHNTTPSIALASYPNGKSGIFKRKAEVGGDHYLTTWSDNWIKALHSNLILPLDVRTILISHAIYPLFLKWLALNPDIDLHPWFVDIFIDKTEKLQQTLSNSLHATFADILHIWPEILYSINAISVRPGTSIEHRIKYQRDKIIEGLSPIENNDTEFDWISRDGKTLRALLDAAEALHWKYKDTPPLSSDQAATYCLKSFRPDATRIDVLAHTLAHASNFEIDTQEIDPQFWQDDNILKGLVSFNFSSLSQSNGQDVRLACLKLACALRLGCSVNNLIFSLQNGMHVSGLHLNPLGECDLKLLKTLIDLHPTIQSLNISSNDLRRIPSFLTTLTNLRNLDLSGNPCLHNPMPLLHHTRLVSLNLSRTAIPPVQLNDLRNLLSGNTSLQRLHQMSNYVNVPSEDIKVVEDALSEGGGTDVLLNRVAALIPNPQTNSNLILYILQRLADIRWTHTLGHPDISTGAIPSVCPSYEDYIRLLGNLSMSHIETRACFHRLLFSIYHRLPVGTVPASLLFQGISGSLSNVAAPLPVGQNLINQNFNPAFLIRIEISGHQIGTPFFNVFLPKCTSIETLYLKAHLQSNILQLLPRLPSLKSLDLSGNNISSLIHLHTQQHEGDDNKFENLELLCLANNSLTSGDHPTYNGLAYLNEMERLDVLQLNNNQLSAIPPLKPNKMFRHVDLTNNFISDFQGRAHVTTGNHLFLLTPQLRKVHYSPK